MAVSSAAVEVLAADAVAHRFEVVQSIFPGWSFTAFDDLAAFGLHGSPAALACRTH